jgi:hypothetical protein
MRILQLLEEGYQDRVDLIANRVVNSVADRSLTVKDLDAEIDRASALHQISDWRLGGAARRDFVKDVKAALKGRIKFSRPGAARAAEIRAGAKSGLTKLAQTAAAWLMDELGNQFPDGDPSDAMDRVIDRIIRRPNAPIDDFWSVNSLISYWSEKNHSNHLIWLEDQFWPLVRAEFKKQMNGADEWDYLADHWDSHAADMRYDAQRQGKDALDHFDQTSIWAGANPYKKTRR